MGLCLCKCFESLRNAVKINNHVSFLQLCVGFFSEQQRMQYPLMLSSLCVARCVLFSHPIHLHAYVSVPLYVHVCRGSVSVNTGTPLLRPLLVSSRTPHGERCFCWQEHFQGKHSIVPEQSTKAELSSVTHYTHHWTSRWQNASLTDRIQHNKAEKGEKERLKKKMLRFVIFYHW